MARLTRARRGVGVGARDRGGELVRRRVHGAVERHRDRAVRAARRRRPPTRPAVLFFDRHEQRKGLAVLLDAWRRHRPRRGAVGRRLGTADRRAAAPRRRRTSSGSARSPTPSATRACAARRCSARRRCSGESFGVVLLEGDGRRDGGRGVGDRRLPERRARRSRRAARAARRRRSRCATALRRCSTTRAARRARRGRAASEPPSSRWRASPSATSSCTSGRSLPRSAPVDAPTRRRRDSRSTSRRAVRVAVAPALGDTVARGRRRRRAGRRRHDGDRRDRRARRRDRVLGKRRRHRVLHRRSRLRASSARLAASSSIDPIDGTRPRRPGSRRAVCRSRCSATIDATLADVEFGVVHELKTGHRFVARAGAAACDVDGGHRSGCRRTSICARCSGPRASAAARRCPWRSCSSGSSTASPCTAATSISARPRSHMTRIVTGQLDAYVDLGRLAARRAAGARSRVSVSRRRRASARTSRTTWPRRPDRARGRRCRHRGRRRRSRSRGRFGRRLGVAVLASARSASARRCSLDRGRRGMVVALGREPTRR